MPRQVADLGHGIWYCPFDWFFVFLALMRNRTAFTTLVLLTVLAVAGCRREYDPVPATAKTIFPLTEGKSRIYHVTDTSYQSATLIDARTYYKRELNQGTETDLLDREVTKLWLYTSPDTLGTVDSPIYNWDFLQLWTQYLGTEYGERIEGTTRRLVLRWPPYLGSTWNGNLYNNGEVQTYQYMNLDTTVVVRGKTYEHCVYVLQVPFRMPVVKTPSNPNPPFFLIEHAYEIYAPEVGKVVGYYKYYEEQVINGTPQIDPESRIYYEELVTHDYF